MTSVKYNSSNKSFHAITEQNNGMYAPSGQSVVNLHCAKNIISASGINLSCGWATRSDTNRIVQPQKMANSLEFRI